MAFSITTLNAFTAETAGFVAKKVLAQQTLNIPGITLIPGVKGGSTVALNKVSDVIYPKAGGCGFTATGATTITQNMVTPVLHQVNKSWCPETLYPTYLSQMMSQGSMQEDFPESQFVYDLMMSEIQKSNEIKMWQGSVSGGDLIDGFLTKLTADSSRISGTTVSNPSSTTIDDMVNDMYNSLVTNAPELLTETDLVLVMAPAKFALYTQYLRSANLYNYGQQNDDFNNGVYMPGTGVRVKPINGLVGSTKAILTSAKNLAVVFDGVNDDMANIWYSKDNQELRGVAKWSLGVGYYFAEQIICNF